MTTGTDDRPSAAEEFAPVAAAEAIERVSAPSPEVDPEPPCTKDDPRQQLYDTVAEITILQTYARSVGKRIPEQVLDSLGQLIDWTLGLRTPPAEPIPTATAPTSETPATRQPEEASAGDLLAAHVAAEASGEPSTPPLPRSDRSAAPTPGELLKVALSVHGQLSELVAPATLRSLKATDPAQPLWSWIKQVWVVPLILLLTVVAFVALVATEAKLPEKLSGAKTTPEQSNTPQSPENRTPLP